MSENITIELYDGPAVRGIGVTHKVTVDRDEYTGEPDLDFMQPGTCFRNEGGPYLEIVVAVRDRQKYTGHAPGHTHEIRHVYLAREVDI